MARIASTVADLIGNTPLVRINHVVGDGVDVALDEEVAGSDPPVGPSYPRVNTKMTMPRRIAATIPRLTSTIVIIGNERRPRDAVAAAGCATCAGCRAAGVGV